MRAFMVLTPAGPVQRAARAGELGGGRPWQPDHLAAPKLADVDVLVCVYAGARGRPRLVAVLYHPARDAKGWRAASNTTRPTDILVQWHRLSFADGGPTATSDVRATLKRPRLLSSSDLKLLKIRAPGAPALPTLALTRTLEPTSVGELSAVEQKQLEVAGVGYDGQRQRAADRSLKGSARSARTRRARGSTTPRGRSRPPAQGSCPE